VPNPFQIQKRTAAVRIVHAAKAKIAAAVRRKGALIIVTVRQRKTLLKRIIRLLSLYPIRIFIFSSIVVARQLIPKIDVIAKAV